uniref:Putative sucrose:fructan fructosyl transferase 2 n=1 Tax=Poa pratensis TaxID=4545 RepID=E3T3S9_POAPR|nr:putative sucrose:fructan fructosyl transferase 2 [Poa pratensis]
MESKAIATGEYAPLPSTGEEKQHPSRSCGVRYWRACVIAVVVALVVVAVALAKARMDLADNAFPWSNSMLQWQRAGFHFQTEKNFMSDPNGPVYYRGYYHLFYQYNRNGVAWDDGMAWGHVVSRDLVHWRHLPMAMVPDHWYDIKGVLSGSITVLHNGTLVMLYTGVYTNATVMMEVQCVAVPADLNDPLLRRWTKHPANPVIVHPPGIKDMDFRDPTTAWFDESDSTYRTIIGSKDDHHGGHAGFAMVYKTKDLLSFQRIPGILHRVEGTGMWECMDFYPVGGGDNSSSEVLYVIKASMDDERHDYYALGRYDAAGNTWTPLDPELDLGMGLRYDWGKFYASTSFYDPVKRRRVMLGYVGETDSRRSDEAKGWASIQSIPRTVALDEKTWTNLLLWPVQEIETLRANATEFNGITIDTGSVFLLPIRQGTQLDIEASFRLNASAVAAISEADVGYNCSSSGGAATRGVLGPFGLLVLADGRGEQTAVYFYVSRGLDGGLQTSFCNDESRSSWARDVTKRVVGSTVPVLDGEVLSMRVLVDHSIVQSFAMGGRVTATSRVYPTEAIYAAAGVYLFNNATGASVAAERLVVHEMDSVDNNQIFLVDDW